MIDAHFVSLLSSYPVLGIDNLYVGPFVRRRIKGAEVFFLGLFPSKGSD